jgi:hypothetical protein
MLSIPHLNSVLHNIYFTLFVKMLSICLIIFTVNKAWYLGTILQKLKKLKIERWGFHF